MAFEHAIAHYESREPLAPSPGRAQNYAAKTPLQATPHAPGPADGRVPFPRLLLLEQRFLLAGLALLLKN